MKRIILTLSSLFLYSLCSAQSSPHDFQNLITVAPVSPDAANLGKFGNIPVSYATGVPSVNIPLFEINTGHIKIPLSLDYHGGGVRVDEISSSVGTSWSLSGIGLISRNLVGLPDESSYGGYLQAPSFDTLQDYYGFGIYGPTKDKELGQFMQDVRDNIKETEPDVFSFTLNGSGGKFVYRPNGSIMQIPVTNNRIERVNGNDFKITDENGLAYIFDQHEMTSVISASATGPGGYISAWRLSKIISPSMADTVYFKYQSGNSGITHSWNYSYTFGSIPEGGGLGTVHLNDVMQENSSISTIEQEIALFPSEISWRGGKVVLVNAANRLDRPTEFRLDSVKVYSKLNGVFNLVKNIKLYQSYFYSNPVTGMTPGEHNYRLRLDSVAYLPVAAGLKPQTYSMVYNNTPIAPNESFGQDYWGFNNGKYDNQTLMPRQSVLWKGGYYNVGEADTDPDQTNTFVQACMLQSIRYPTKGKTVFEFEPHKYRLNYRTTQQITASVDLHDGVHQTTQTTFTLPDSASAFRYSVMITTFSAQQGVTDYPRAILTDQTTGAEVFRVTNIHGDQTVSVNNLAITLVPGHTYVLTGSTYTLNASVRVQAYVTWVIPQPINQVVAGGGLRIKSITNYNHNDQFINKETYAYGTDGVGTLYTAASYLLLNYEKVFYQLGYTDPNNTCGGCMGCIQYLGDSSRIYHARSVYPASQISGSPVAYKTVTKFDTDNAGNVNGKQVFTFPVFADIPNTSYFNPTLGISTDPATIGISLVSDTWRNGIMDHQYTYKSVGSNFSLIESKGFKYQDYRADGFSGLKIKPLYIKLSGCEFAPDTMNTRSVSYMNDGQRLHYFVGRVPTSTGARLLQSEADTTWDDQGRQQVVLHNLYYDDLTHILPTKKETFNSTGDNLTDVIKYPHDFASAGNVYQKMMDRNIISPVVRFQQLKNGNQLALANINYYDWFGNSKLLLPQTVDEQVLTNPIVTRTRFNNYDAYGDILQQQKVNGPYQSYQWGYNKQYPVVVIANAASNEFYAENFEESTAANVTTGTGHTGTRFYNGSYTVNWTRPNSRSYVISYWYLSNGSWLLQNAIPYTGSSYTLTGGSAYDDIRIYPVDSQMSTYTYLPLIGMTSATDAKNLTTYYEYDDFQRLKNVKDKDGNIVKHDEYHYKEQ
ncbi:hypothetical protein [Mucilaginibacter sp. NFR10]|uniref:hypothetical protein n=1 Tax=Mucilaginibacter sp. NFR10 TaxID=1566292 RepID=UPI0008719DBE|nr:hypothetical protein [Mucilaginibacter sp. NFR10]SCW74457.1 hypothetical protein SAMN03159284_03704 [Mucilaginibacter sp. NFR10]